MTASPRPASSKIWPLGITVPQRVIPYLFLLPALVALGISVFWPALRAFYLSFTTFGVDLTAAPTWVGWANVQRLKTDPIFWQTVRNTLVYLAGVVPILTFAPLGLAILVNRQLRGIHWLRVAYYSPVVVSMVVAGIAWRWLYAETGLFNQVLKSLGLTENGIPWLTSPALALFSVMVVTVWKGLGYYMVIYLAGLQGIPQDLYEAAALDGSDGWRRHWDITLPLMRPYLVLVSVISAIAATKVFEEVYIMTQGGPRHSSKTVVYYIYEQAFQKLEISYACTIGLGLFLVILVLSALRLAVNDGSTPMA
ncbi:MULTISPECIES: sugar ABC transporter permease [Cyanophyceae]|uniref:carbohydrate ABC transporter permease n=1 Tax=Cyanophyceae TaxID=3028117 RepID=UPI00168897E7|nr:MULTISPECIES: sugar ABC transporter permease [Cyanophyceae]MBD1915899.1 sugar ABC transporter permease [Phormidium sp. FACHB-77]MBD2030427.1 sugar ABC transporter permease [Phormidium sp. FACHB-322]MBD2053429.1 sugar ABC transporter permease [Leptolyngbya sp. FACHB-60]